MSARSISTCYTVRVNPGFANYSLPQEWRQPISRVVSSSIYRMGYGSGCHSRLVPSGARIYGMRIYVFAIYGFDAVNYGSWTTVYFDNLRFALFDSSV